jgi:hypothetical protein
MAITHHPMAAIYTDLQQAMELLHMLVELRALELIVVRDGSLVSSWLGVCFVVPKIIALTSTCVQLPPKN